MKWISNPAASPQRDRTSGEALASRLLKPLILLPFLLGTTTIIAGVLADRCCAAEAQWIWSPEHTQGDVPQTACHFRKSFVLDQPESGHVSIAADDGYELYVNGRRVGEGGSSTKLDQHDITPHLVQGRNTVAVRVVNREGATAALAARVMIKELGGDWSSYSTNGSWKTQLRPLPLWSTAIYNDSRWAPAQVLGLLTDAASEDRRDNTAGDKTTPSGPFTVHPEFAVQLVLSGQDSGSLIAITFNEFGQAIVSQRGGPLLLAYDSDKDKQLDKVRVCCDKVKNCQGVLALNGDVFVTGAGPEGSALYRLADEDRDGRLESVRPLLKFAGEMGEYGPHGVTLGPDGLIYVAAGSQSALLGDLAASSPHRDYYEGDLPGPRYEDPGGRAVGVKAPGGVVIRTDIDGRAAELVAGGLWNAYDLAFNRAGDLFVDDWDMEADDGAPWRRPARLYHVIPGAEFGWRSGWAKWPSYFVDALPPALEMGVGSPTGAVFYDHYAFPARFHNTLFLADSSRGCILNVRLTPSGGSYVARSEVFLEGQPLRVTDLDVGPDGALYFVAARDGTEGGVYRISWRGKPPAAAAELGDGVGAAIRQPQLHSAWSRQRIARLKNDVGDSWKGMLLGVARSPSNPWHYRVRAMDLLQLFGPLPTSQQLIELSQAKDGRVRAKAAELMGLHANEGTHDALTELLQDSDGAVRRKACEALVRAGQSAPVRELANLLESDDRHEAWAARRLLERTEVGLWRDKVLEDENHRLFIQGALALMIAHGDKENALRVLRRFSELMVGFISDQDFVDMLRVAQVAMLRGGLAAEDVPQLRDQLADEFPARDARMNRELARLLTHMQVSSINDRYLAYLKSDVPNVEKIHLALLLRFLEWGWTSEQRLELLDFYEEALTWKGGASYPLYVAQTLRDFAKQLGEQELRVVMEMGAERPNAALAALYRFPPQLNEQQLESLKQLDQRLAQAGGEQQAIKRLQVGLVAVLARSKDEPSMSYLRQIWERDPERRLMVAFGLAQSPVGKNWQYVVRSLPILEGDAALEVLTQLCSSPDKTDDPEHLRQLILLGQRLKADGATQAVNLLQHWTGERLTPENSPSQEALAAWQTWLSEKHPERPEAKLLVADAAPKWEHSELLRRLSGEAAKSGSAESGKAIFEKAQCLKCHRYGDRGERIGPDLSTVSKRLTKEQILQSTLSPSHVISNQYAAKTVTTKSGRSHVGVVTDGPPGEKAVLQSSGERVSIPESEIDKIVPSKTSVMPTGLLDSLAIEEICSLLSYLSQPPTEIITRREDKTERK